MASPPDVLFESEIEMLSRNHFFGFAALALALVPFVGTSEAMPHLSVEPDRVGTPAADAGRAPAIVLAQAADPNIMGLQEEIRRLNGRVEELNFQLLQMQDELRRMKEDTEFRFQQLEGGASPDSASDQRTQSTSPADAAGAMPETATADAGGQGSSLPGVELPQRGEPPRTLGTITFDENGNVVSTGTGEPIDLLRGTPVGSDDQTVAALPPSDNPEEIYRNAYQFILSGDYGTAEAGFRQYIDRFPEGEHGADAHFWLGEAMLSQDKYREAAEVFLQANRDYPDSSKAPEMLLKLGVSLAALNQRDVACATYTEIGHRYPDISSALKERVTQEQALAGC